MKKIFFIILIFSVLQTNAQTNVVQIGNGIVPQNHISYFLPQTEIAVAVTVKGTIKKSGRFANYAKRLLALDNVISSNSTIYSLENSKIYYNIVPDSNKYFAVEINQKTTAYNLKLSEKRIIEGVNYSKTSDYAPAKDFLSETNLDTAISFDYSVLSEDALMATSEAKMAEMAAKQIFKIRESRMEILSGESEKEINGDALSLIINELYKAEKELIALFEGKAKTFTETKIFYFTPKTKIENEVIFRFSPLLGIVEKDDFAGRPITLSVEPKKNLEILNYNGKKIKNFGIYYNVPSNAEIAVFDANKMLAKTTILMPQFGILKFLPAELFNKKSTQVVFTEFGGIEEIIN